MDYEKLVNAFVNFAIMVKNVVIILWKMVTSWIKEHITQIRSDVANLVFSIKEVLTDETHRVIHGVFNERTGKLHVDTEDLRSEEIDSETRDAHRDNKLVIFDT